MWELGRTIPVCQLNNAPEPAMATVTSSLDPFDTPRPKMLMSTKKTSWSGDQLATVEFGELVTFTPFPKRNAPRTKISEVSVRCLWFIFSSAIGPHPEDNSQVVTSYCVFANFCTIDLQLAVTQFVSPQVAAADLLVHGFLR